jgi:hypothetical protein
MTYDPSRDFIDVTLASSDMGAESPQAARRAPTRMPSWNWLCRRVTIAAL